MASNTNPDCPRNFLVIALLLAVTGFTALQEGYFPLISLYFALLLLSGFGLCFWLACSISTQHLLALILSIFIIEYVKETIGIISGLWVYHGIQGAYNFGIWCWVLGGLNVYTLATRIIIPRLKSVMPVARQNNVKIVLALFLFIPVTLLGYWHGTGGWFWSFYLLILLVCLKLAPRLDFPVLAGLVVAAWLVGIPAEYVGGVSSQVWTFPLNPHYPPVYLVIGCWPLEILTQYGVAALVARQPLNPPS